MWMIVFWENEGEKSQLKGTEAAVKHAVNYFEECSLYYIVYDEDGVEFINKDEENCG